MSKLIHQPPMVSLATALIHAPVWTDAKTPAILNPNMAFGSQVTQ